LTGSHATGDGANTLPFLYQGPLTSAAEDSGFHAVTPPFAGFMTGTFYGPDTSTYNPDTIPAGQVRAVGSYRTGDGVFNHGMIYLRAGQRRWHLDKHRCACRWQQHGRRCAGLPVRPAPVPMLFSPVMRRMTPK